MNDARLPAADFLAVVSPTGPASLTFEPDRLPGAIVSVPRNRNDRSQVDLFIDQVGVWLAQQRSLVGDDPQLRERIESLVGQIEYLLLENRQLRQELDAALEELASFRRNGRDPNPHHLLAASLDTDLEQLRHEVEVLALELRKPGVDRVATGRRFRLMAHVLTVIASGVTSFGAAYGGTAAAPQPRSTPPAIVINVAPAPQDDVAGEIANLVTACRQLGEDLEPRRGRRYE